jgi:hypothetical protein
LVGAAALVNGRMVFDGQQVVILAKAIDTETGRSEIFDIGESGRQNSAAVTVGR